MIKLLIDSQGYLTTELISDTLDITPRTVYSMLQRINDFLDIWDLERIQNIRGHGYYLLPEMIPTVKERLKALKRDGSIEIPVNVRCKNIVILLMTNIDGQTIDQLNLVNHVSRSTTLKDMQAVQNELTPYDILIQKKQDSFYFTGKEIAIRTFAMNVIDKSVIDHDSDFVIDFQTQLNISEVEVIKIEGLLLRVEEDSGRYFTDESLIKLKTYLCFMMVRLRNDTEVEEIVRYEYRFSDLSESAYEDLLKFLKDLNIPNEVLYSELNFLIKVVTTYQLQKINLDTPFYATLFSITGNIVQRFQSLSGLYFDNDKELKIQMYTHLLAAQNRVKYNMQFHNEETKNIKEKYQNIYVLTKKAVKPFEDYLGKCLNDDELALISIYFGSELERLSSSEKKVQKTKLLVVCGSGLGISRMLEYRLSAEFRDTIVTNVITKREYEDSSEIDEDFVISTMPVSNKGKKIFYVTPTLSKQDVQELERHIGNLKNTKQVSTSVQVANIIDVVAEYTTINDFKGLSSHLTSLINDTSSAISNISMENLGLLDVLPTYRIKIMKNAGSWNESIKLVGELLKNSTFVTETYIDAIINQLETLGPYMIIAPGILLAHAPIELNPTESNPCMSMIKFDQAINFGESKKIKIIFCLYSPNTTAHLNALTQLTEVLSNRRLSEQLWKAKRVDAIEDVLAKVDKQYFF